MAGEARVAVGAVLAGQLGNHEVAEVGEIAQPLGRQLQLRLGRVFADGLREIALEGFGQQAAEIARIDAAGGGDHFGAGIEGRLIEHRDGHGPQAAVGVGSEIPHDTGRGRSGAARCGWSAAADWPTSGSGAS